MITYKDWLSQWQDVTKETFAEKLCWDASFGGAEFAVRFTHLLASGYADQFIPEFAWMIGCEQNVYHEHDVMTHTILTVANSGYYLPVVLAALFHDVSKPFVKTIHPKRGDGQFLGHEDSGAVLTRIVMDRYDFDARLIDEVCHLIQHHLVMYQPSWSNKSVRKWIARVGYENVDSLLDLYRADLLGKGNAKIKQPIELVDELRQRAHYLFNFGKPTTKSHIVLSINGSDVMDRLGIGPGPKVGKVLKDCEEYVKVHPNCNNQHDLFGWLDGCEQTGVFD